MKEATKRAASEALAQMLAVTAMLVIASYIIYVRGPSLREAQATKQCIQHGVKWPMDCFASLAMTPRHP